MRVTVPRIDAAATVDGQLDEAAWRGAARLTGFSQLQPVDGLAAVEPTEVLVWYAPDAIWFGIRARDVHGDVVRATRANRDNIGSEDHVQILLDTYDDRRNSFLFGVNALGVQQDGTRSDQFGGGAGGRSATGGGMRDMNPLDGNVDLNPDFVFESRGRLVPGGYDVEVRIPFKALRYQDTDVQQWGIHVLRRVQHTGVQDTWAPAVRANSSFLAQSGSLAGLSGLRRGLVLEATPTMTSRADRARSTAANPWQSSGNTEFGGDLRWGIRQNLTANATINPDFSQVEADIGQVTLNQRFALFYPEKRPFFLDGLELFDSPNQLVYTRRIISPDAGVKLAGKVAGTNVATMVVGDAESASWSGGSRPVFGIARLKRDLGRRATLGSVLTTREDGGDYSRLAGADFRLEHDRLYWVQVQAVRSFTDSLGTPRDGSLVEAVWDRTGRAWGFNYSAQATSPDFRAAAGFVNRTGTIDLSAANRVTFYGGPDDLLQQYGAFLSMSRIAGYVGAHEGFIEGGETISPSATLRGGWRLNGSISRNFVSYAAADYAGFTAGGAPFIVPPIENDLFGGSVGFTTPVFRRFSASMTAALGETAIFREAAPGVSRRLDATVDLRPTSSLRTSVQVTQLAIDRSRDDSRFSTELIPRVKVEYQLLRSVFVRGIAQYTRRSRDGLVDRTGAPIAIGGTAAAAERLNELQADWLFSYRPNPGTLFYAGYGTLFNEPADVRLTDLTQRRQGFFAKASYLFRF